MKKTMPKFQFISTFENASIIRKFSVLFLVASILPLIVIYSIFITNIGEEYITIPSRDLGFTMLFATLGILAAFITMRSLLVKIIQIHEKNQLALKALLDPQLQAKFGEEQNEIDALARSLSSIQKKVDEHLRDLEEIKRSRESQP